MALVFHERLGDLYRAGRDGLDCQETHASRVCQVVHWGQVHLVAQRHQVLRPGHVDRNLLWRQEDPEGQDYQ